LWRGLKLAAATEGTRPLGLKRGNARLLCRRCGSASRAELDALRKTEHILT